MSTLASVIVRDIFANRPAAGIAGRLFFASDTGATYRDNGTTWDTYSGGTGTGTVTSVALTVPSWLTVAGSPVTTAGTLAVTGTSQAANLFLASPNGSAGAMTPRAIVAADLPLGSAAAFGAVKVDGTTITASAGVISAVATGTGTVTSVGLSLPALFTVTGTPVTTTGTLTATLATQTANQVWAGPTTGAAAAPTFRALVAADLPLGSSTAFGAVKVDGTTITASAGVISAVAATPINFADNEILVVTSGPTIPALAHTPNPLTSLHLEWQGARQRYGTDFTVSGTTITAVTFTPSVGDNLIADYRY